MPVESQVLSFSCLQSGCEGDVEINLETYRNLPAWGLCDVCGTPFLSDSSASNRRMVTEEGIEEIDPDDSLIEMVIAESITFDDKMAYELSQMMKRGEKREYAFQILAEVASYSDTVPIPEEVEEMLSEASIELETVRLAMKGGEPAFRTLSNYYGQEVRNIIEEGSTE